MRAEPLRTFELVATPREVTRARKGKSREETRASLERAIETSEDPVKVLALLHRLARESEPGSPDRLFADANLAELLVDRHPWRASLHARRALAIEPELPSAWASLALAQTLLGHFRFAARAYERALTLAPGHTWYAHNLGHLLDVAIDDPERALPLLATAYTKSRRDRDVAASYAHALARTGRVRQATAILERVLVRGPSEEHAALLAWIEGGMPAKTPRVRPRAPQAEIAPAKRSRRATKSAPRERLREVLLEGLVNLPFSREDRAEALALAHEVTLRHDDQKRAVTLDEARELAAACCLATAEKLELPLSVSEIAAPFRIPIARLRARTFALRKGLALLPVRHQRGSRPEGR